MEQRTPSKVAKMIKEKQLIHIIDVREVDEVAQGKIPNATHIPLGLLEFRMHELDKNTEYTMVCRSGGRSMMAAKLLEDHGYRVVNMSGGMLEWEGDTE